jgi:signal transduction histidine kinase/CheY-like chemotaxis protein
MTTQDSVPTSSWSAELEGLFEQMQRETIWLALPGLFIIGMIGLLGRDQFRVPDWGVILCVVIFALALIVAGMGQLNYTAAAWTLVIGCLVVDLLAVTPGGMVPAIYLLVIPAGLATLTITRMAGVGVASVCMLYLFAAPATLIPATLAQRAVASLATWSTVGLIWLVLRPLLMATESMWSGYERSRTLLEQSRDYQLRLAETLSDLTSANTQLTRLNQQAQALRQAAEEERRAKEQFVANVSHELRTPLNMIIGFAEMMLRTPETYGDDIPPSLLADLAVVLRNSQHLSSLIDDVLDLSQMQASQMALTKERVALAEVIQAAVIAVRPLFESKKLHLEMEIAEDLPLVLCDRTRIREVVLNLLSNAGRFTEQGGVRVNAWQDSGDVVVSVVDTGPGIAEEAKGRLFRPFQQLDGTLRRRYGGSGLGLAISKNFVDLHNGQMWLESQLGIGTTVFFRLPITPAELLPGDVGRWFNPHHIYEGHSRPSRLKPVTMHPRVVVVEHGTSLQRLMTRYGDNLEVIPVRNLEQASQELARTPAQALLVNADNPDEVLRQLNASDLLPSGIPALVCSLPSDEEAITALGVAAYLVKPIAREALLAALERLGKKIETVLVVDDEPDALQLFRRMLSTASHHYRVIRAANGQQALELLRTQSPDVVLLDLVMPEMDGFQLLAIKNQSTPLRQIPVILTSAQDLISQPLVSHTLSVTLRDGLPVPQLLACFQALNAILSPLPATADSMSLAASPD